MATERGQGTGALAGRVAIVTGAARGIGFAIAARLAADGASIALTGRDRASLDGAVARLGPAARGHVLDVRRRADVERVVADVVEAGGRIDILVNNAGLAGSTPLDGDDDALWDAILETNVTGAWHCTRAAVRHMGQGGRVIHIASVLGKFGVAGSSAYCASKHAVIGMMRAQALELAPRGITVNAICPGWVDTEMARASMEQQARLRGIPVEAFRAEALAAVPQRRMLAPAEVAALAAYLAREESAGLTGQALSVDGGQTPF